MKFDSKSIKLSFCILVAILGATTGCIVETNENDVSQDVPKELTIQEINADRGDACECVNASLLKINSFIEIMNGEEFSNSQFLNEGLTIAMEGCMEAKGHREADRAWSDAMAQCESFTQVRDAMLEVRKRAIVLKNIEQEEFAKTTDYSNGIGAAGILDRLRDGTQVN